MSNEELQVKIDEYCGSQAGCEGCIFNDTVGGKCLAVIGNADNLTRLEVLNRFKKEILGEEIPYKVKGEKVDFLFANKETAEGFIDMVKRDNILDNAIAKFGELQLVKASEECCELAQALNKYYCMKQTQSVCDFKGFFNGLKTNIIEEIADVEIMIEQVKRLLAIGNRDIELIKEDKIERLGEKLK